MGKSFTQVMGIVLFFAAVGLRAVAAAPVELQWAFMGAGPTDPSYTYSIVVSDMGQPKTVGIWYKDRLSPGPWAFQKAGFVKKLPGGRELWQLVWSDRQQLSDQFEFAVRYTVAGATYWDNNQGRNYRVAGPLGVILGGTTRVIVPTFGGKEAAAYDRNGQLNATIYVSDPDPDKTVGVLYTTDGWKTKRMAYANFYGNGFFPDRQGLNPGEIWTLNLPAPGGTMMPIEFAAWHVSNGVRYWDNNFGQNYKVALPQ